MKSLIVIYVMLSIFLLMKSECIENPADATEDPDMPEAGCVILYEEKDYGGSSTKICYTEDIDNLNSYDSWDDNTLSIRLGFKTIAVIYEDNNYAGTSYLVENNIRDLSSVLNDFGDGISSIRLMSVGCFQLFADTDFLDSLTGKVCVNDYSLTFTADQASSILIGPNTIVRFYDGTVSFNNPYSTFDRSVHDLSGSTVGTNNLDNFQILSDIPDGCVIWLDSEWDKGNLDAYTIVCDGSKFDLDDVNSFGSPILGGNTRIILFEKAYYTGVVKIIEGTTGRDGNYVELDSTPDISPTNNNDWDYDMHSVVQLGPGCIFLVDEDDTQYNLQVCRCVDKIPKEWNNRKFKVYLGPGTQLQLGRKNLKDFFLFEGMEAYINPGLIKSISGTSRY